MKQMSIFLFAMHVNVMHLIHSMVFSFKPMNYITLPQYPLSLGQ